MNIGSALRARREALGITAEEIAKAAGLNRAHVTRVENGERAAYFGALLHALGLELRPVDVADDTTADAAFREAEAKGLAFSVKATPDGYAQVEVSDPRPGDVNLAYRSRTRRQDIGAELVRLVGVAGR